MAHISNVYSAPEAGLLTVVFSGIFYQGQFDRISSLLPSGGNCLIGASVNGVALPAIDRFTPTTTTEFNYPGGNAPWPVSTFTLGVSNPTTGGPQYWGMRALKLDCRLTKK